jgi:hypothetical protein
LTCEFAGVFEAVLAKKNPDYFALTLEAKATEVWLVES